MQDDETTTDAAASSSASSTPATHHGFVVIAEGNFELRVLEFTGQNLSTGETQRHAQDQIFIGDYRVGYIGHEEDAKIALIVTWGRILTLTKSTVAEVQAELLRVVTESRDGVPAAGINIAPQIRQGEKVRRSR